MKNGQVRQVDDHNYDFSEHCGGQTDTAFTCYLREKFPKYACYEYMLIHIDGITAEDIVLTWVCLDLQQRGSSHSILCTEEITGVAIDEFKCKSTLYIRMLVVTKQETSVQDTE